jgi:predicted NodU family carbamoyl transferase|tara:strand:- start:306 stop:449 length:144 start_codon:yes stop_codon:yes gene_type:complete
MQYFKVTSILGIYAFYHDRAVVFVIDGKIIATIQEEDPRYRVIEYPF